MTAEHSPAPAARAADPPKAYTARIVAAGVAAAVGAVLASMIDSRGTVVGAMLVSMTVSALGQAMRRPLDRLERRLKGLGTPASRPLDARVVHAVPAPAPSGRAGGHRGVGRSILVIGLLGFLVGMGVFGASEIAQGRALAARIVQMLPSRATIEDLLQLAQSAHAPVEEADEEAAAPPSHAPATPTPRLVATPTSGRPTPGPSAEKVKIPENAAGR